MWVLMVALGYIVDDNIKYKNIESYSKGLNDPFKGIYFILVYTSYMHLFKYI